MKPAKEPGHSSFVSDLSIEIVLRLLGSPAVICGLIMLAVFGIGGYRVLGLVGAIVGAAVGLVVGFVGAMILSALG